VGRKIHRGQFATLEEIHGELAALNRYRLVPTCSADIEPLDAGELHTEVQLRILERRFVEAERQAVEAEASRAPRDASWFVHWFESLKSIGPGQGDPLFPWLAEEASLDDMRWFLRQEVAGEAGFEDLVALTQVRLPTVAKLEMARNYWDEMGRGDQRGMHGPMLERLAAELDVHSMATPVVWQTVALGNLMVALAANRCYTYQSVGALGVIELTAPGRAEQVNAGLRRLEIGGATRRYYALHAQLDKQHAAAWIQQVLFTLVAEDPSLARPIAEGALMRLRAGERCFSRYRAALWSTI